MQRSRLACWMFGIFLAGLQAFAGRYSMNPDALSYLDLARAFLTSDFREATNPYWGPLYPSILALAFWLVGPTAKTLFPLVHAVNFGIFVAALVAFEFLLRELLRGRQSDVEQSRLLSTSALVFFTFAVFLYSTLHLIGLQLVTPDLCVAAVCFTAAALILRVLRRSPTWPGAIFLGVVLGLGYLAKSVMFPLGLLAIFALALSPSLRRKALPHGVVAAVTFGAIALPLIVLFSQRAGQVTFGTSGKLSYAFMVNDIPYTNWQGDPAVGAVLVHPPRLLSQDPEIFDYTAHPIGTYPAWFDPTYWNAGLRPAFRLQDQLRALLQTGGHYVNLFLAGGVAASLLVWLTSVCGARTAHKAQIIQWLPLFLFAAAGLAIYLPVYLENRYIASFAALIWILPVAAAVRPNRASESEWLNVTAIACAACLIIPLTLRTVRDAWESRSDSSPHAEVARYLGQLGIRPGLRVADIGSGPRANEKSSFDAFWAYLAQVQIIAEIPDGPRFLCADPPTLERAYAHLARLGARVVVTAAMPSPWCSRGWDHVPGTEYYVRRLFPAH
jgi:hypothetical protein